jgi:hypothetical protein
VTKNAERARVTDAAESRSMLAMSNTAARTVCANFRGPAIDAK